MQQGAEILVLIVAFFAIIILLTLIEVMYLGA